MTSEWKEWCGDADDMRVDKDTVEVKLPGNRSHRVSVEPIDDGWMLSARIASGAALSRIPEPELYVWERNRTTSLVGFRIDKHDRLVGEASAPSAGMDADEFRTYVRALATECDRLEALLTGDDVE